MTIAPAPTPPRGVPGLRTAGLDAAARRALGELAPVLDDPELRDLLVQVRDGAVTAWVDCGGGLERLDGWHADPAAVRRLATNLIAAGGRQVDELHPAGDVRLGAGIRVHAVLPPIAPEGAAVSIRVPRGRPLAFADLARRGLCDAGTADALRGAVAHRRNLLITGGTGSGNTTCNL